MKVKRRIGKYFDIGEDCFLEFIGKLLRTESVNTRGNIIECEVSEWIRRGLEFCILDKDRSAGERRAIDNLGKITVNFAEETCSAILKKECETENYNEERDANVVHKPRIFVIWTE